MPPIPMIYTVYVCVDMKLVTKSFYCSGMERKI